MEPTYRIAQRLHERRAAKGLETYGRHLDADSDGCMLVHALEESADKTNYLIAEVQRRQKLMKWLKIISDEGEKWSDWAHGWFVDLGGAAALAKYDEILGTVAEDATVDPDPRDEALRLAEEKTWKVVMFLDGVHRHRLIENYSPDYSGLQDARVDAAAALAAIRGAR